MGYLWNGISMKCHTRKISYPVFPRLCRVYAKSFLWSPFNILSIQCFVLEMSCLWNVFCFKCPILKCPLYEMSCLWNALSMKCPFYEMSCLWNFMSMKCPVYEMSCLWNVLVMKYPIYEICPILKMSYLWNILPMICPSKTYEAKLQW